MDVLSHLEREHRQVEALFAQLEGSEPGVAREKTIGELAAALTVHMEVEERFIYPFVADWIGTEENSEATNEHELAREGLRSLQQMSAAPGFGAALDMVRAGIDHHVEEEETELFPALRATVPDELARLDPEELAQQVRAGSTGRSGIDGPDIDLTKDDLYKQAQDADVTGRSSMTKAQLVEALSNL